ncbi:MAG: 2-C-methyl-D-erythritol 4-phosphate cytidylyltransferase [Candidatus Latescibacterota bacterium]|nr:MAG: 2-C-methyl-D-erythritol 4-phosphate cytidylyltransferase [Candidatus Latescibacterota bacterium]
MPKTIALIMAAGTGERFEGSVPKKFYTLLGRPMIVWATECFAAHAAIDSITIVAAPGEEERVGEIVETHRLHKVDRIVPGGQTRQESVWLGLETFDSFAETVLVHDAARPCLTHALVDRVLDALKRDEAVVPAWPVVDTLVREEGEAVDAVLDRVHISGVQTPQGFRTSLLVRAHRKARARGFSSSDDGSLVFALGENVRTIPGERTNIKVTFVEDAVIAEAILEKLKR